MRVQFPRVEAVILGFDHAAEYLSAWAQALHPNEHEETDVAQAWCHRLKHEGGEAVLADLKEIDASSRSPAVQETRPFTVPGFGRKVCLVNE